MLITCEAKSAEYEEAKTQSTREVKAFEEKVEDFHDKHFRQIIGDELLYMKTRAVGPCAFETAQGLLQAFAEVKWGAEDDGVRRVAIGVTCE
ncbi:unnamed protein product [Discula destructiva]